MQSYSHTAEPLLTPQPPNLLTNNPDDSARSHREKLWYYIIATRPNVDDTPHPPDPPTNKYPDDAGAGAASGGAAAVRPDGVLLEQLMDLLDRPLYTMSGPDLDELLQLIEVLVAPLANLKETPRPAVEEAAGGAAAAAAAAGGGDGTGESGSPAVEEESKMEVDSPPPPAAAPAAAAAGRPAGAVAATATSEKYEWVKVPAPVVQHERLRLLCSVLRLEACSDNSFQVDRGWSVPWCSLTSPSPSTPRTHIRHDCHPAAPVFRLVLLSPLTYTRLLSTDPPRLRGTLVVFLCPETVSCAAWSCAQMVSCRQK